MNAQQLIDALSHHHGTQGYTRHWTKQVLFTDGVMCFLENAGGGAHWFGDIVATELAWLAADYGIVFITLEVKDDRSALIHVEYDENLPINHPKQIGYTDCPQGSWKFYLSEGEDTPILLLPSEY